MGIVAMEVSKLNLDARSPRCLKAQSSLVRRLVQARDDPAKRRIRPWLSDINDERLLAFGLTQEDIALLRRVPLRSGQDRLLVRCFRRRGQRLTSAPSTQGAMFWPGSGATCGPAATSTSFGVRGSPKGGQPSASRPSPSSGLNGPRRSSLTRGTVWRLGDQRRRLRQLDGEA
jgi:hypothetical protein